MKKSGVRSQESEVVKQTENEGRGGQKSSPDVRRAGSYSAAAVLFVLLAAPAPSVHAQEDPVKFIEQKRAELKAREDAVKRDEERLAALKKDVDAKIEKYTKLLAEIEAVLKKVEQAKDEKMTTVVKAYEAMSPEEAAPRISALDGEMAVQIMIRMKSKKAGAVMALMEPNKAALLTKSMATVQVKK